MADIVFISPYMENDYVFDSVGTLLLATILHEHGLNCKIYSLADFGSSNDFFAFLHNAVNTICAEKPKIISFYTRCDIYHIVIKIAEQLKKHTNAYIVFGGPQSDLTASDTINHISHVDFICCGEGENTIYPFFLSLLNGSPDLTIPGLVYRANGKSVMNPRPELLQNLDALPSINYSLYHTQPPMQYERGFQIDVGRGCPFGCTYCSTKSFWQRKYRIKSPQRIVDEIKDAHERFGVTYFLFEHDMFTMNRTKVIETCHLIKQLGFPISWRCSARIDCIDNELIDIMTDAGMSSIFIGVETGSARMQKIINKKLDLSNIFQTLSYLSSKKCPATASFIYGFPEETEEDISETINLIGQCLQLKHVQISPHLCTFLPGTEMTRTYLDDLTPASNFSNITAAYALSECADLIYTYPAIFPHFWEYQTPLREKLTYFEQFINAWKIAQPIYQHISQKYYKDSVIQMYYAFCAVNKDILQKTVDLPVAERNYAIFKEDRILDLIPSDPLIHILRDLYKMIDIRTFAKIESWQTKTEVYCFSPKDAFSGIPLAELRKQICIVTYTKDTNNQLVTQIKVKK